MPRIYEHILLEREIFNNVNCIGFICKLRSLIQKIGSRCLAEKIFNFYFYLKIEKKIIRAIFAI